jgi:hypothetical protein
MQANVFRVRRVWSVAILTLGAMLIFGGCQSAPTKNPNDIIRTGITNLMGATSGSYDVALKVDITDKESGSTKFDLKAAGILDRKDMQNLRFTTTLDGSVASGSASGSGAGELRLTKAALFFNLAKLEMKDSPLPEGVKKYFSKWWKYSLPEDVQKEISSSMPEATDDKMTPEQKQMKALIAETNFFTATYAGMKDVKGESSYHYTVKLDKAATIDYLVKMAKLEGTELTDAEKKDMSDAFSKVTLTGDIYVGAASLVLDEFDAVVKFDKSGAAETTGTVTVNLVLGDINKTVTLEEPQDALEFPINDFAAELSGGALPVSTQEGLPAGAAGSFSTGGAAGKIVPGTTPSIPEGAL